MARIRYHIVRHDGGWTYRLGDVFAETFATHTEALVAARVVVAEQAVSGTTVPISWQDPDGKWHEEVAQGDDRPQAMVVDDATG